MSVKKDNLDAVYRSKNMQRVIRRARLDGLVAAIMKIGGNSHASKHLVFNDKDFANAQGTFSVAGRNYINASCTLSQMRARDKAGLTHRHAVTTFSSFTHFGGELFKLQNIRDRCFTSPALFTQESGAGTWGSGARV